MPKTTASSSSTTKDEKNIANLAEAFEYYYKSDQSGKVTLNGLIIAMLDQLMGASNVESIRTKVDAEKKNKNGLNTGG